MANCSLTKEAVEQYVVSWPHEEMLGLLHSYYEANKTGKTKPQKSASMVYLQEKMITDGIFNACPHCGSINFIKYGKQPSGLTCYKCKDCNQRFNVLTGTILDKTHWTYDIWIKVLEMTINNTSVRDMVNILERDCGCTGINVKTVWHMRMKLVHALATLPQPQLTGVIQIDETFVRESQKGSRQLINYLGGKYTRLPRYGVLSSAFGTMGTEFCTVVTAVDDRGYCVGKVLSMGKVSTELFFDCLDSHIESPRYVCTDGNPMYSTYCKAKGYMHYIKPSNYRKILENSGYAFPTQLTGSISVDEDKQNLIIKKKLFRQGEVDKLLPGCYTYEEFVARKKDNHLFLSRVNELHSDIKKFINADKTNVSSKYLQDYLGFFLYIRNWKIDHGRYPKSASDAETLFFEILTFHSNFTKKDIKNTVLSLPQPTGKYTNMLIKKTEEIRNATDSKYFKFNPEDGVYNFDKRTFLSSKSRAKLCAICKANNIREYGKWSKHSLVTAIVKLPNVDEIIQKLIIDDRVSLIDDEDIKARNAAIYKH